MFGIRQGSVRPGARRAELVDDLGGAQDDEGAFGGVAGDSFDIAGGGGEGTNRGRWSRKASWPGSRGCRPTP